MARTPVRMSGPAQVSNAAATKYTVPATTLTIMRHIHIQNPSGSAVTFTMSIGADAAATRIFDAYSIPAAGAGVTGSVLDFFGYWVLAAAEIVQAFAGTNNVLTLTVNGDQYTLG